MTAGAHAYRRTIERSAAASMKANIRKGNKILKHNVRAFFTGSDRCGSEMFLDLVLFKENVQIKCGVKGCVFDGIWRNMEGLQRFGMRVYIF